MPFIDDEIASQSECWEAGVERLAEVGSHLPAAGERVAVVGCGTSWFIAQAYAARREALGLGETDAFASSEMPAGRRYDRVLAITRSGTTTEVLQALGDVRGAAPTTAITAAEGMPVAEIADHTVELPFADERSVVQTRFATTTLALLRASLGEDLDDAIADAHRAVTTPLAAQVLAAEQITFLGRGWAVGLAHEAALKMREAAGSWTESYPAMEYRHGPISVSGEGRVVWALSAIPESLAGEIEETGAHLERNDLDPMAGLVRVQLAAARISRARGLDPDHPRHLARSVILPVGG